MHFTQQTLAESQATKCKDLVSLDWTWSKVTCLSELLILDFFLVKKWISLMVSLKLGSLFCWCVSKSLLRCPPRWEYQTAWPASWETCMQARKQQLNLDGTTNWFQIGKGICQGCILSPYPFNLYAEYIMRNAGLDEAQAGIKIARRHINNLRYADDTPLWQKVKRN